ncbi:hypothetical protein [Nocardia huaxiensis]|uniref:Ig-like domain-containing protein n=1 Tax=Nocardia huaxiensis TaxID=2755382 RepID=A0A7D6VGR2_9NOCA|nr:hypothetical protein [Nocardia huaxiensis]QLY29290.1 hypothetical protein H0264_29010 [Nocardia huaxiensis]UFS97235.1 hypothetical protein LPY97_04730 [Nocardia huaxiensis]
MTARPLGALAVGVAAAAAVVTAAPQAAAETYTLSLTGSTHVVGCTYTLSIEGFPKNPLSSGNFADNGKAIGSVNGSANMLGGMKVSWTPKTAGAHELTASVGYLSAAVLVTPRTVDVAATGSCSGGGGGLSSIIPSISG